MSRIYPRTQVPTTNFKFTDQSNQSLAELKEKANNFVVLLFYRGYHCPKCKIQLQDFNRHYEAFKEAGIDVYAISTDHLERAEKVVKEWEINQLPIAYDFPMLMAEKWGLYLSAGRPDSNEPSEFAEPGLFVVRPDGALYASAVQTMPFTRPKAKNLLEGLKYVIENDYPARGEIQEAEQYVTV
ncbi:MAG: redoxin domain-containing protein [Bacteroidota bacterium]